MSPDNRGSTVVYYSESDLKLTQTLSVCQKAKTREQREAEVIPRLTEAVKHGISVMENAFVTLELTTERK